MCQNIRFALMTLKTMGPAALTGQKSVEQAGAIFKMIPCYLTAQRGELKKKPTEAKLMPLKSLIKSDLLMFHLVQWKIISNHIPCNFSSSSVFFLCDKTVRQRLLHFLLQIDRCRSLTWHFNIIWEASGVQVFQEVSWHSFHQDHVQSHLPLRALTLPRCCQMMRANVQWGAGVISGTQSR